LRKVYELANAFAERLDLNDLIPFSPDAASY
jgi:hypothetical protein